MSSRAPDGTGLLCGFGRHAASGEAARCCGVAPPPCSQRLLRLRGPSSSRYLAARAAAPVDLTSCGTGRKKTKLVTAKGGAHVPSGMAALMAASASSIG